MIRMLVLMAAALLAPTVVAAQSRPASATLTVEHPLTVASTAPLRLKAPVVQDSSDGPAAPGDPTVVLIGGDPGRVYRVSVPDGSPGDEGGPRIISDNAGDVSETGLARLDAQGRDRLQISGFAGPAGGTFPLNLVYE